MKKNLKNVIYEKIHIPVFKKEKFDIDFYLTKQKKVWSKILLKYYKKYNKIKFDTKLTVKLQKRQENNVYIYCNPCFRTESKTILSPEDISDNILFNIGKMLDSYDIFMKQGSGWILNHIMSSQLNIYLYKPLKGGGGKSLQINRNLLLPEKYRMNKRSILFFEPTIDQKCFLYCILGSLFPQKGKQRNNIRAYLPYESKINTSTLKYPVDITQIPAFEKNNNLCINVFTTNQNQNLEFIYHSKMKKYTHRINLLLYKKHFSLIQKWSCFLNYTCLVARNLCQTCGLFFKCPMNSEKKICSACSKLDLKLNNENSMINLEFKNSKEKIKFSNFRHMRKAPFILYADIETSVENLDKNLGQKEQKTIKRQKHNPIAIGYLRVCTNTKFSHEKPVILTGEDCIDKFFRALETEIKYIEETLQTVHYPINMNREQENNFSSHNMCYICNKLLLPSQKMRDHDHLLEINNYLGVICNSCNLNRTDNKNIRTSLVFHAGGRFDINFLLQKLYKNKVDVTGVIGKSGEQIMSMCMFKNKILIIDSLNHLSSSLANLVEILRTSNKSFTNTVKYVGKDDDIGLGLLTRKGVFPYSYITNIEKLNIRNLPEASFFYDELKDEPVKETEYQHAKNVWEHFQCKNLKEYMEIYLSIDITLLADVFENYRAFFFKQFNLEVSKYVSLPALSYDCMLKYTKCQPDYVYNPDIYYFLKKGIRGGISMIPHRKFHANNPLLSNFNPEKKIWYIIYIDANSLYSSIMNMKLPYKNLEWVNLKTTNLNSIENLIKLYNNTDDIGYFLEVDLQYPLEIKEKTKYFPLAPEHKIVTNEMLSPFSKMLKKKIDAKNDKIPKLLSTQYDKIKYICHIENLQFYLRKGMKLTKVHRILKFQQKDFIKPYIEFCISQRNKIDSSPDEKSMWKLACNAIFGKTIQNSEKMNSITFHTNEKKLLASIASPRFKHADLINDYVSQVTSYKKRNCITTPYFVGVAILELSKLFMMKVFYDFFMEKYGIFKLKLLMTDTDSLLMAIQTNNIYEDLKDMKIIEFGNLHKKHPYYKSEPTGKLFHFKDESCGYPIQSFVGLRSKCYSIHYEQDVLPDKISAKGVNRGQIKKMKHDDLNRILSKNEITNTSSLQIRSFKHQLYNVKQNKLSLSGFDTKRWISWDNISTLPYGHPSADEIVENFLWGKFIS